MKKPELKSFIILLLTMICLGNSIPTQSQKSNLITVDRDRLKAAMEKADLVVACEKRIDGLEFEVASLKENLQKKTQEAQANKKELDEVSDKYNKARLILVGIGVLFLIYFVIKIRF